MVLGVFGLVILNISWFVAMFIGVGALASALLAIHQLWNKLIKPFIEDIATLKSLIERDQVKKHEAEAVNAIVAKELSSNNGSSLKDQVSNLQRDVYKYIVEHENAHVQIITMLNEVKQRVCNG